MTDQPASVDRVRPVSIRLPDDLAAALERESQRLGVGVSELIREGILLRLALAALHEQGLSEPIRELARRLERH